MKLVGGVGRTGELRERAVCTERLRVSVVRVGHRKDQYEALGVDGGGGEGRRGWGTVGDAVDCRARRRGGCRRERARLDTSQGGCRLVSDERWRWCLDWFVEETEMEGREDGRNEGTKEGTKGGRQWLSAYVAVRSSGRVGECSEMDWNGSD